jgi:hypothetical protein
MSLLLLPSDVIRLIASWCDLFDFPVLRLVCMRLSVVLGSESGYSMLWEQHRPPRVLPNPLSTKQLATDLFRGVCESELVELWTRNHRPYPRAKLKDLPCGSPRPHFRKYFQNHKEYSKRFLFVRLGRVWESASCINLPHSWKGVLLQKHRFKCIGPVSIKYGNINTMGVMGRGRPGRWIRVSGKAYYMANEYSFYEKIGKYSVDDQAV